MNFKFFLSLKALALITICLTLGLLHPSYSQEAKPTADAEHHPQSFFVELGGNALYYSINYDRRFAKKYSFRGGVSVVPHSFSTTVSVPVMVNYLAGRDKNFFEIGLGVSLMINLSEGSEVVPTATIGYRYQPVDKRFLFRAGFTPFFQSIYYAPFLPWLGVSFGYTLKRRE